MGLPELVLKVRVQGRHPWFYRKMIRKPERPLRSGGAVQVVDRERRFVGVGFYNPRTELALRMLAREPVEDPGAYLVAALDRALDLREQILRLPEVTNAYRLVHAEGDGFPGLVLDRLGDTVVAQVFALCLMDHMEALGEHLLRRAPGTRLVLTVDEQAAEREGIERPPRSRPHTTEVVEHGVRYEVQPGHGHKTGFFADQRDNRLLVRELARGRRVLDLCCHAGGFALAAARGGARTVLAVDLDEAAVAQARGNAARNGLRYEVRHDDAFEVLRGVRPGAHDLIVLDPPKWAAGRGEVEQGLRRYADANRLALAALSAGGILVTCSCSGAVSEDAFLRMLRGAAAEAGRDARILAVRGAGPDHPVALECPETRYLKVVALEVR